MVEIEWGILTTYIILYNQYFHIITLVFHKVLKHKALLEFYLDVSVRRFNTFDNFRFW